MALPILNNQKGKCESDSVAAARIATCGGGEGGSSGHAPAQFASPIAAASSPEGWGRLRGR